MNINFKSDTIPSKVTIELSREELIQLAAVCGKIGGVRDKIFGEIYHSVYDFSDFEKENLVRELACYKGEFCRNPLNK